ncbi:siderophore-interacting protein [Denitromonas ohlonensis]|uniref:Siderophore-interacting protein n=2 Tax=Denitromonas TaxID=139331 RepID=A0A557SQI2_9RHOO|nr:siderophore-interacting protein [Denitromonas ohlonensis]TVO66806.1 siderophore-interacting protein [Denitromonas ohlonensis]TVO79676.1 siderophore-interacting protein [Denitromonas ohlonensis]
MNTSAIRNTTGESPARRKPILRPVSVRAIEDLGPRMRRVTFLGDSLEGFGPSKPGSHIKLFFGDIALDWQPMPGQPRPTARTYTPRYFDPVRRELVVDFVRHGQGVASEWVEQAQVGSVLIVAGPGGGQVFPDDLRHLVLFADESALPAAGTILDSLPPHCMVTLFAEVADTADQRNPSERPTTDIRWLPRLASGAAPGSLLLQAARNQRLPDGAMYWVACEATAMRDIRQVMLNEHGIDRAHLVTRGYWKAGASDHPDHDMGE